MGGCPCKGLIIINNFIMYVIIRDYPQTKKVVKHAEPASEPAKMHNKMANTTSTTQITDSNITDKRQISSMRQIDNIQCTSFKATTSIESANNKHCTDKSQSSSAFKQTTSNTKQNSRNYSTDHNIYSKTLPGEQKINNKLAILQKEVIRIKEENIDNKAQVISKPV